MKVRNQDFHYELGRRKKRKENEEGEEEKGIEIN